MELRDLSKCNGPNDGTRTLVESVLVNEVQQALTELANDYWEEPVLVGDLAVSYWAKPRVTTEVELLFYPQKVPTYIFKFDRMDDKTFKHKSTKTKVLAMDSKFPEPFVKQVHATATRVNDYRMPSREAVILMLCFRFNYQDRADIEALRHDNLMVPQTLLDLVPERVRENYKAFIAFDGL